MRDEDAAPFQIGDRKVFRGKILVAEDDPMCALSIEEYLNKEGFDVVCVSNGRELIDRYLESNEWEFGAMLIDCHMPLLTGYDAIKIVRSRMRKDAKTMPVFLCTASLYEDEVKEFMNYGGNEIFLKPVYTKECINTIKKYTYKMA